MQPTPSVKRPEGSKDIDSEDTKMKEQKREWKFAVKAETASGETVHVVGSCGELGTWMSSKSVQLVKDDVSESLWCGVVSIPCDQDVEFRYFVGVVVEPDTGNITTRKLIVRRWETHIHPRIIKKEAKSNVSENSVTEHVFGVVDQTTKVERGWLTYETVVQLKFFNKPLQLWKKRYEGKKTQMKVTPVNLRSNKSSDSILPFSESIEESTDTHDQPESPNIWPLTEFAVMNEENRELRLQEQFGCPYNGDDFIQFQISMLDLNSVAYLVDLYICNAEGQSEDIPSHIGFSHILPSVLKQSEGRAVVPITSTKHRPIGQLTVEYLVVLPIVDFDCDMRISFARMWKQTWQGLDVGHRGFGSSFKMEVQSCSEVRENTIASLKAAALHGADMVEFDVQLTKDLVPVIYHDFHVCIAMRHKKLFECHDTLELPLKDLTLEQLQRLKVYHVAEGQGGPRFFDEDLEEHQPFPTLQHALETLDTHVGFNVEVKWTMELQDGSFELYHPFEVNMYLDTVLKVVLEHAGNRKIIFSCFHPDICTMIRLKQNKYPVMFLTQGVTAKYPPYHDLRCQSIPLAMHYAVCTDILGINVHTEDVLRDPTQVKLVTDAGLIIFCWGDDNNNRCTIQHLKKLGLHGIIFDKIDQFGTKEVKESIFLAEAREAQEDLMKVAKEIEQPSSTATTNFAVDVGVTRQTLSALSVGAADTTAESCSKLCTKTESQR